ncbi:MAG: hypothetical protein PWP68_522 [Rikenellaceae bacterium]|nr:hypothetical protein [Rikenellaceae bacterium]
MDRINIGILFPSLKGGGVFQYALSIYYSLIKFSTKYNYYLISAENFDQLINFNPAGVNSIFIPTIKASLTNKIGVIFNLIFNRDIFNTHKSEEISSLKERKIALLIIPFPSLFGFRNKIPYIVSIPDLMHKYYPSFPEYPLKARLLRDIVYKNSAKYSVLTIVDSHQGLNDLNRFFNIPKGKIRIIPYIPAPYIYEYKDMDLKTAENILKKYPLPEHFLFYPAQFWYHKNHIRLIQALKNIKQDYKIEIPLVLVGSPKESYKKIMDFINKSNMSNQIYSLGYVSDIEIVALYKKAVALVYPSLFGPTNIPPLEAMVLGTPVLCSNIFSMPEQIGNAGLLFDPFNVEDIAEKIYQIWTNENLRNELVQRGYERVKDMTLENYAKQWEKIIDEAIKML